MTSIAKSARVALAVTVLALATAGAASADAFHPDPFVSTGVPAAAHPDPGRIQSVNPAATRAWDYARPATGRGWSHLAHVSPKMGCGTHPCTD